MDDLFLEKITSGMRAITAAAIRAPIGAATDEILDALLLMSKPVAIAALAGLCGEFADRLKQAGFSVDLKEYSNTMMLSRVVSGKYDVFLASDDFIDVTTLTQMDYMIMDSEEMR